MTSPIPMVVITTTPEVHGYLTEVFQRALSQGLINPDELQVATVAWASLRRAAVYNEPPPPDTTPLLKKEGTGNDLP